MIETRHLAFTFLVLVGINTVNFYDRQVLGAVQEKVRTEWRLSDSQLGWLGTAFILLYAVVGLPLGRLADRARRKWVLAAGVGLWSVLTFACGFATGFWSLFVLRLGVGIGEASCAPARGSVVGRAGPGGGGGGGLVGVHAGPAGGVGVEFFCRGRRRGAPRRAGGFFRRGGAGPGPGGRPPFPGRPGPGGGGPARRS